MPHQANSKVLDVLLSHTMETHHDDYWLCCSCGHDWPLDGPYVESYVLSFSMHLHEVLEAEMQDGAVERVARAIGKVQYGDAYLHVPEDMHSEDEACMHCLDLPAARAAIVALFGKAQ